MIYRTETFSFFEKLDEHFVEVIATGFMPLGSEGEFACTQQELEKYEALSAPENSTGIDVSLEFANWGDDNGDNAILTGYFQKKRKRLQDNNKPKTDAKRRSIFTPPDTSVPATTGKRTPSGAHSIAEAIKLLAQSRNPAPGPVKTWSMKATEIFLRTRWTVQFQIIMYLTL